MKFNSYLFLQSDFCMGPRWWIFYVHLVEATHDFIWSYLWFQAIALPKFRIVDIIIVGEWKSSDEKTKRQNFMTPAVHYEIIYKLTCKTNIGSKWCLLQKRLKTKKKRKNTNYSKTCAYNVWQLMLLMMEAMITANWMEENSVLSTLHSINPRCHIPLNLIVNLVIFWNVK